jgi:hypothetical protein
MSHGEEAEEPRELEGRGRPTPPHLPEPVPGT